MANNTSGRVKVDFHSAVLALERHGIGISYHAQYIFTSSDRIAMGFYFDKPIRLDQSNISLRNTIQ